MQEVHPEVHPFGIYYNVTQNEAIIRAREILMHAVGGTAINTLRCVVLSQREVFIGARGIITSRNPRALLDSKQQRGAETLRRFVDYYAKDIRPNDAAAVLQQVHVINHPSQPTKNDRFLAVELGAQDKRSLGTALQMRRACRFAIEEWQRSDETRIPTYQIRGPYIPLVSCGVQRVTAQDRRTLTANLSAACLGPVQLGEQIEVTGVEAWS